MCNDYDIEDFGGGYYCPYLGGWCYEDTGSLSCIECKHYITFNKYYDTDSIYSVYEKIDKESDENA